MSYHHQWLYLRDENDSYEVINGARTAAYLKNPSLLMDGPVRISNVLDFGGCAAYAFDPPCDHGPAYIQFPGSGGNQVTVPDAAALDIVGDITLIIDVAMADWTPAADSGFIGKWTSGQLSYLFSINTTGFPYLAWTTNGSTQNFITSTVGLGTTGANDRRAVRVDFDVDNGASGRTARFYVADTYEGPWTLLSTVTTATATSIFSGTSVLNFGNSGGTTLNGKVYYAQIRSGQSGTPTVGGSAVLTLDPGTISDVSAVTFSLPTGQTATIARSGSPSTSVGLGPQWWERSAYVSPTADDAPWYQASVTESDELLGFFIEEWTGLDSKHTTRPVARTGRPGGGGQLGPLSSSERVMKLNVLVLGLTERALEYAFHWLSARLANLCSTCSTSGLLLRRFCPATTEDLWNGVAELRQVGLVEDLSWESQPIENGGCYIRRLSFSLAAGDPCMYLPVTSGGPPVTGNAATCFTALPIGVGKSACRPMCVDMPASCRTVFTFDVPDVVGAVAPVLTMVNESDHPVPPLRVLCYADPHDEGIGSNPCGLAILGEIYTQVIPPWTEIKWDVAARQVLYSDHTTTGYEGGFRLMDAVDRPFTRFFTLPCGPAHIVVEPANTCLTVDAPNSRYTYDGYSFLWAQLHFPTMSLQLQERLGCA